MPKAAFGHLEAVGKFILCPQSTVSFVDFSFSGCLFLLKWGSVVENYGL